jgi:hypothetical protein
MLESDEDKSEKQNSDHDVHANNDSSEDEEVEEEDEEESKHIKRSTKSRIFTSKNANGKSGGLSVGRNTRSSKSSSTSQRAYSSRLRSKAINLSFNESEIEHDSFSEDESEKPRRQSRRTRQTVQEDIKAKTSRRSSAVSKKLTTSSSDDEVEEEGEDKEEEIKEEESSESDHSEVKNNRRSSTRYGTLRSSASTKSKAATVTSEALEPTNSSNRRVFLKVLDYMDEIDSTTGVFAEAVDVEDAPDYYEVIDRPVDRATIRFSLFIAINNLFNSLDYRYNAKTKRYSSLAELVEDVLLMYENCKQYNVPASVFSTEGNRQCKLMKTFLRDVMNFPLPDSDAVVDERCVVLLIKCLLRIFYYFQFLVVFCDQELYPIPSQIVAAMP